MARLSGESGQGNQGPRLAKSSGAVGQHGGCGSAMQTQNETIATSFAGCY